MSWVGVPWALNASKHSALRFQYEYSLYIKSEHKIATYLFFSAEIRSKSYLWYVYWPSLVLKNHNYSFSFVWFIYLYRSKIKNQFQVKTDLTSWPHHHPRLALDLARIQYFYFMLFSYYIVIWFKKTCQVRQQNVKVIIKFYNYNLHFFSCIKQMKISGLFFQDSSNINIFFSLKWWYTKISESSLFNCCLFISFFLVVLLIVCDRCFVLIRITKKN